MSELRQLDIRKYRLGGNGVQPILPVQETVWLNYGTFDEQHPEIMYIRLILENDEVIEIPLAEFESAIRDWHLRHWDHLQAGACPQE